MLTEPSLHPLPRYLIYMPCHRLVPPALKPSEIQDNGRNHEYIEGYRNIYYILRFMFCL